MNPIFEALLRELNVGVIWIDPMKRIKLCNPAAHRMLNSRGQSMEGRTLIEATLSYEMVSVVGEAQERGIPVQRELRKNDTTGRTIAVHAVPVILDDQKGFYQIILMLEDVTEIRHLETVRRDFVANVSHELRTPLASIRAMAETLQNGASGDTVVSARFLEIIVGEVERLTRLLHDLLTLSKAEQEHIPERERFDLLEMVQNVVERYQSQAEMAGVQLQILRSDKPAVEANRDQIEQVLINLVDNAIKYTPDGGEINIRVMNNSNHVTVEIEDTGIGILSQDLARLWERFYRADRARSRQSGGTGLGLSIVKHIVEAHGGSVGVESEYGQGSVFHFTLPYNLYSSRGSSS